MRQLGDSTYNIQQFTYVLANIGSLIVSNGSTCIRDEGEGMRKKGESGGGGTQLWEKWRGFLLVSFGIVPCKSCLKRAINRRGYRIVDVLRPIPLFVVFLFACWVSCVQPLYCPQKNNQWFVKSQKSGTIIVCVCGPYNVPRTHRTKLGVA